MKPCNHCWREGLMDHAAGAPAGPELAAHLADCSQCSITLRDWQQRMARIDAGIREVRFADPPHQPARLLPRWRIAAPVAAVVLALFATNAWRAYERRNENNRAMGAAAAMSDWKSPTDELLHISSVAARGETKHP